MADPARTKTVYMKDRKIGDVLIHMGLVTAEEVENAVYEARLNHEKIGRTLIRSNLITAEALCRALSLQSGMPMVDLAGITVAATLRALFPDEWMREHQFVPFDQNPASIFVAVGQPLSPGVLAQLRAHCRREVETFLAQEDAIALRLDEFQRLKSRKHERFPVSIPAQYQFCTRLGAPLEPNVYMVSTLNLSLGGLALQGAPRIPNTLENYRRQDIYAQVLLKDSPSDIRSICQLRWVREAPSRNADCLLGMEIVEISTGGRQRIQDLCERAAGPRRKQRAVFEEVPEAEAPKTQTLMQPGDVLPLTVEEIRATLRSLGLLEDVVVHEQQYQQFMQEQGIKELGRGGEGAVYFLRGHVVKVVSRQHSPAALREIAHMLHLNPLLKGGSMGDRVRQDWPALLWVYLLSNGGIAVGMKPFDPTEASGGTTLAQRLAQGPPMDRQRALETLCLIGDSMAYAHAQDIIHHDLKPGNIFIPTDASQCPVVFDLGQALWKKSSWGRDWLANEHNRPYQYNGTYRYMHAQRRLAHAGALALLQHRTPSARQSAALGQCRPSTYDDVFAFARIVRDAARSQQMRFTPEDRKALLAFSRDLMGMAERQPRVLPAKKAGEATSSRLASITSIFRRPAKDTPADALPAPPQKWTAMKGVVRRLYGVLDAH